jgi:hypothetical protein
VEEQIEGNNIAGRKLRFPGKNPSLAPNQRRSRKRIEVIQWTQQRPGRRLPDQRSLTMLPNPGRGKHPPPAVERSGIEKGINLLNKKAYSPRRYCWSISPDGYPKCGQGDAGAEADYRYLKNSLALQEAPYLNERLSPSCFRTCVSPFMAGECCGNDESPICRSSRSPPSSNPCPSGTSAAE